MSNYSKLKKGVIRMEFKDSRDLYQSYMPFIEGCGLFYPTKNPYKLDQEIFIFLQLPNNLGKFAVPGRIVWLNPPKEAVKRVPGVGIQLRGRETEKINDIIRQHLDKMIKSGLPTLTL